MRTEDIRGWHVRKDGISRHSGMDLFNDTTGYIILSCKRDGITAVWGGMDLEVMKEGSIKPGKRDRLKNYYAHIRSAGRNVLKTRFM